MLLHRHLTGSLIRLSESKLKCCSAKFEDGKKLATVFTIYIIVSSWYIAKGVLDFKKHYYSGIDYELLAK